MNNSGSKRYRPYIPADVMRQVQGTALFYPHSADDLREPILLFAPFVTDFWFVDLAYFRSNTPADRVAPVLAGQDGFVFESVTIKGPPSAGCETRVDDSVTPPRKYRFLEPCVRTEKYRHVASGEMIRVHRRRGYSVSGFRKEDFVLGVFFYRRDSWEGSTTPWLTVHNWHHGSRGCRPRRWHLLEVLDRLVPGGLLVTDGSRCEGEDNPYRELRRFHGINNPVGADAVTLTVPFRDDKDREFRCVGYAGQGNGPTLVWQVHKPQSH